MYVIFSQCLIGSFTRALNRLIPKLPSVDYSWVRRRILTLNTSLRGSLRVSSEPVTIALRTYLHL
ncbi:MAG: hypothetical protein QXT49_07190 [Candidatus Nezhaarchaeales archaeon]